MEKISSEAMYGVDVLHYPGNCILCNSYVLASCIALTCIALTVCRHVHIDITKERINVVQTKQTAYLHVLNGLKIFPGQSSRCFPTCNQPNYNQPNCNEVSIHRVCNRLSYRLSRSKISSSLIQEINSYNTT